MYSRPTVRKVKPTPDTACAITNLYMVGVDRNKLFIVPEAVDTAFFDPEITPMNLKGRAGDYVFLSIFKVYPSTVAIK
jgi:hypothetical protein